jgi:ABC-2 type transport system permease protein
VALSTIRGRARRFLAVTAAFVHMGAKSTFSYPLSFVLLQLAAVLQVVGFLFLERLVRHSSSVGSSYLAFAMLGIAGTQLASVGVVDLGNELDSAIQQGRLEMYLVEPISWRAIPLALAAWPSMYRTVTFVVIILAGFSLGARLVPHQVGLVCILCVLAILSGLVIGVLAGCIRVLAKRSSPISTLYIMAASILTGQYIPLNVYPRPLRTLAWLFPNTYVISGLRKSLLPNSVGIYGPDAAQAILLLLGGCVILLPMSLWIFGRTLETGRKYGILAGY